MSITTDALTISPFEVCVGSIYRILGKPYMVVGAECTRDEDGIANWPLLRLSRWDIHEQGYVETTLQTSASTFDDGIIQKLAGI